MNGSFLADNNAAVFLNTVAGPFTTGTAPSTSANFKGPATTFVYPNSTFATTNSLVFKVGNGTGTAGGFDYSATVTCAPNLPDLTIVKTLTSPPPWQVGGTYTFTTVVTNNGPGTVPAGAVISSSENPLPAGLTLLSTNPTAGCPPQPVTGGVVYQCGTVLSSPLGPNGTVTITWTVRVDVLPPGGKFTNCVVTAGQLSSTVSGELPEVTTNNNKNDPCVDIPVVAPPSPKLDHFKCYLPRPTPVTVPQIGGPVSLQDQFDGSRFESVAVRQLVRFCNPVAKRHLGRVTPVTNPRLHLAIYSIETKPTAAHAIVIGNQFGSAQSMRIGPPRWLAVPTSINSNTQPDTRLLSHFKCYPVLNIVVDLFDASFQHVERNVAIGAPFMFCNAALKVHNKTKYPAVNPKQHLVCYQFAFNPFSHSLAILNQFNRTKFSVIGADLLCVPSTLLRHTP